MNSPFALLCVNCTSPKVNLATEFQDFVISNCVSTVGSSSSGDSLTHINIVRQNNVKFLVFKLLLLIWGIPNHSRFHHRSWNVTNFVSQHQNKIETLDRCIVIYCPFNRILFWVGRASRNVYLSQLPLQIYPQTNNVL